MKSYQNPHTQSIAYLGTYIASIQCDQIGQFVGLWAFFKAFGNNYFFVKVLKSIIFRVKSHFGLLLYTFGDCFLVTLLLFYTQMTTHFQSFFTTQQLTLYLSISRLTTLALYFIVFFAFTVSLDHSIHKYFPTLSVSLIRKSKLFADPGTPTQTHTQLAKTIQ